MRSPGSQRDLAPHLSMSPWFTQIVDDGTGEQFSLEVNQCWPEATRHILEAFFHARDFLEMVCKYEKELNEAPDSLASGGWQCCACTDCGERWGDGKTAVFADPPW
jgi:hypothetical protein